METATAKPATTTNPGSSPGQAPTHLAPPSPEHIMKLGMGFWASKILLTAVEFDLFTHLAANGSMSASEVKQTLGLRCTDRHLFDFLDSLTGFGFVERKGILADARYSNTAETAFFLDRKKPSYLGGILEMANNRLYGFWANLSTALRTGEQQNEAKTGEDFFGKLYSDRDRLREFVNAMSGVQMGAFIAFANTFDFSKAKTLADIGGSGAHLSLMVAKHQPHMSCVSFDLPPVQPIAHANISHFNLNDRVSAAAGDFFADALPKADVITMGNILHDWDAEKKVMLMRKAYDALPEGGAFVAIENVIDNERKQNVFGLMMSLNMLIETAHGFDYSFDDFSGWAKAAGFKRTQLMALAGPTSAAVAYK
ncbi:MAG TPA: methyltransferase [Flavobacteriales bacterium]|nr:methyltransferase [Flavobacteriales bacterium]